jgi:hypothetical protein
MKRLLFILLLTPTAIWADCRCACVQGEIRAMCTSAIDIEPICHPGICSAPPPSVKPPKLPVLPPLGTSKCALRQVQTDTGEYQWQMVCH